MRAGVKIATAALLVTSVAAAIGVTFSFHITHGSGLAERTLALVVFWPVILLMLIVGDAGMPDALFNVIAFAAEFFYIWALTVVTVRLVRAARRA